MTRKSLRNTSALGAISMAVTAVVLLPMTAWGQTQAQTGKVFEMPGVFRVSLPAGWEKTKTIDDRLTVAVFSSKDLTLEVMRDLSRMPVEQYAQSIPDRRLRTEADDYPGAYSPLDVMSDPDAYTVEATHHFDEYTSIGGLPALWMRNRLVYTKPSGETHTARVWSVLILSSGPYWSLELRGDDRSWPGNDGDLRSMIRSFQFLEPTLTRVKAAIPPEAWKRMPSGLPDGSCEFVGVSSGLGLVIPCGWDVTGRRQRTKDAADDDALDGLERVSLGGEAVLNLNHYIANWAAGDFLESEEKGLAGDVKADKVSGRGLSYKRKDKREVSVDGATGTRVWAAGRDKKTHNEIELQLLTVSSGTDHFSVVFSSGQTFARDHSDEIERMMSSIHLFPLRTEASADAANSADAAMLAALLGMGDFLSGETQSMLTGCNEHPDHPPAAADLDRAREDVRLFNDSGSHLRLGDLLRSSGDCKGGAAEIKTAVQINPRNSGADEKTARIYLPIMTDAVLETLADRGDYPPYTPAQHNEIDYAIAAWERVLAYAADGPSSHLAHEELASLYSIKGYTSWAIYHKASSGGDSAKVHRSPDEIAAATKIYEKAGADVSAADEALKSDPSHQNRLHEGETRINLGDLPIAASQCDAVHRIDPRDLRAISCLARLSDAFGEREAAIGYVNEWLAIAPNAPEAYFWLARAYQWEPADYKKAAESYKSAIDNAGKAQLSDPMLIEARVYWPRAYENGMLWQEAADAFEANVHDAPNDGETLNAAAWFFATTQSKLRNPAKALAYANRAVAAAPADANIVDTLAEAYFINGRIDQAVTTEQKALTIAPDRDDLKKQLAKFKDAQKAR